MISRISSRQDCSNLGARPFFAQKTPPKLAGLETPDDERLADLDRLDPRLDRRRTLG
jgi:hypothetical protein